METRVQCTGNLIDHYDCVKNIIKTTVLCNDKINGLRSHAQLVNVKLILGNLGACIRISNTKYRFPL